MSHSRRARALELGEGDDALERFLAFASGHEDPDACWLWAGYKTAQGYGQFRVKVDGRQRVLYAHRWAYARFVGPLRMGMTVDHLQPPYGPCTSTSCVNPLHLEQVPRDVNSKREGDSWRYLQNLENLENLERPQTAPGPSGW